MNPEHTLRILVDLILIYICKHLIQEIPHGEPDVIEHLFRSNVFDALSRRESELLARSIDK